MKKYPIVFYLCSFVFFIVVLNWKIIVIVTYEKKSYFITIIVFSSLKIYVTLAESGYMPAKMLCIYRDFQAKYGEM